MASTIKVDNIQDQCGSAVVTKCGASKTLTVTTTKADNYQAADGGNIINQCGTAITIGASGDTVSLASGASQSGFGRSGTVDWQTGSIKTSGFTAADGEGYFCNTSGGAFTVTLPSGSAGAIVAVSDYTRTFQTNNLTVSPQSGEKIGGIAADAVLETEGQTATFVYVDSTEGWINVQETSNSVTGNPFLQATGGTITTCGNCKIHTFTGPGTFTVTSASATADENVVSYLVVAGGAGAGGGQSGGGGAGGFRELKSPITPYTASPLNGYPTPGNRITVTATAFPITVGAGGAGVTCGINCKGSPGGNSIFSSITAAGGGGGGGNASGKVGIPGGSGGGSSDGGVGASGNTPPTTPPQGNNGGSSGTPSSGGGGGGANAAGADAVTPSIGANGGNGVNTSIVGSPNGYAGGGGGGGRCGGAPTTPQGGTGGGGNGNNSGPGQNGTANTGGGGGGTENTPGRTSGSGGSGIVVIRYKYQ